MSNIKSGEMFNYYECQAVTVVVHVVGVQSFQLASACKSFGAGIDGWLSADYGVRVWSETYSNQQQYIFLYTILGVRSLANASRARQF